MDPVEAGDAILQMKPAGYPKSIAGLG